MYMRVCECVSVGGPRGEFVVLLRLDDGMTAITQTEKGGRERAVCVCVCVNEGIADRPSEFSEQDW